jgi:hypothetical protein
MPATLADIPLPIQKIIYELYLDLWWRENAHECQYYHRHAFREVLNELQYWTLSGTFAGPKLLAQVVNELPLFTDKQDMRNGAHREFRKYLKYEQRAEELYTKARMRSRKSGKRGKRGVYRDIEI